MGKSTGTAIGQRQKSESRVVSACGVMLLFGLTVAAIHFSPQVKSEVQTAEQKVKTYVPKIPSAHPARNLKSISLSADLKQIPFKPVRASWNSVIYISRNSAHDDSAGSGVIVSFDSTSQSVQLLTAAHVIRCEGRTEAERENCHVHAYFPVNGVFVAEDVRVVRVDLKNDEALIRAHVPEFARIAVAPISLAPLQPGQGVVAIGFPNLEARAKEEWTTLPAGPSRFARRFSTGPIATGSAPSDSGADVAGLYGRSLKVIHYADVLPGDSGGGLFNANGKLIGVLTQIEYLTPETARKKSRCTAGVNVCRNIAHRISPALLRQKTNLARGFSAKVNPPRG